MDEDLFDGPAHVLHTPPSQFARNAAVYTRRAEGPDPAPVRHRAGYALFAEFLASRGIDPRTTARDPLALLAHLRAHHREIMARPELAEAAAVFFGNVLVAVRPDALWAGDEVQGPRLSVPPMRALESLGDATDEQVAGFAETLRSWSTAVYPEPLEVPRPAPPAPSIAYARPAVVRLTAPQALAAVARGLAAHVRRNYAVAAVDGPAVGRRPRGSALWTARLVPVPPDAAPLALTAYSDGVALEAGALYAHEFPERNSLEADLDALEQTVLAIVSGWFAERLADPDPDWYEHAIAFPSGRESRAGGGQVTALGAERLGAARARLAALPNGWQPWPLADDGRT